MRTCKNAKTARGFCPYNSRASIFAVLGLSLSVSILFCQDAEGLNPWQSALDQAIKPDLSHQGQVSEEVHLQDVLVWDAGSQDVFLLCFFAGAAAAALDMPRNRDNELFSGPPLESDEDLRYREQLQSQSLEAASSHQNRPWGLYQHPWRLCVHFHRGWILSARLPKAKCWDRWWGQGKTLWNCRRPFEVSLEERAVAG
ncbi:uncharacterized protein LOC121660875 isoform X4 [Corvus kubaryi]|uniref:uncharacterized protein LOC121660875 isoform X4 n=1 Tax=Corvus kubaryi TaxID=68294 RepID=UPI001C059228|nr:uncharacterized protein LOC121660875 isoform X4 [Corvus kubaryi]XP_041876407.1 uncharacterized protein LOC121660875 isoform X4 [Corvus kubaryi]